MATSPRSGRLFPNVRGLRGFLTLVGEAAKKNVSIFDQVAHSTGAMNTAFKTALTNDPTAQFNKMKAQLQVLAIVIGEQLIPILTSMAGTLVSLADRFRGLSTRQQHAVLIAAGMLAVLGPLVSIIGTVITVVSAATVAFRALGIAELFAGGPVTAIVVGLGLLAAALVLAWHRSATFRTIVRTAMTVAKFYFGLVVSEVELIWSAIQRVISAVQSLISWIGRIHFPSLPSSIGGIHIPGLSGGLLGNVAGIHLQAAAVEAVTAPQGRAVVEHIHIHIDSREVAAVLRNRNREHGRQNAGKALLST